MRTIITDFQRYVSYFALIIFPVCFSQGISPSGYTEEKVKGVGLGIDIQSKGANPIPSAGFLIGAFGYLSYQARATISYRPADDTAFIRGGVGLGFIFVLLNFDLTYQTGVERSLGMFWGLSSFLSGAAITPEIFAGYQTNFAAGAENFFLAGTKVYLNFAHINR